MGGVSSEKGVLKLVYPGGSVEIHKEALTAADVMKRNPRHFVTRPDVFKYPWIVVRPESILSPGRVFFVVPYHTIRRLLQSNGIMSKRNSTEKQQKQPPSHGLDDSDIGLHKQTSPREADDTWADEATCKLHESLSNPRQDRKLYEQHEQYGCQPLIEPTKIQSRRRKTIKSYKYEGDYERRHVNSFDNMYVMKVPKEQEHPTKLVVEHKKRTRKEEPKKQYPIEHWPMKIPTPSTKTYPIHENGKGGSFVEEIVSLNAKENSKFLKKNHEVTNLKSCLKKPGINVPKPRGLKVTFVIPCDDDDDLENGE